MRRMRKGAATMTELNAKRDGVSVAENPVIAGWQEDAFEEHDPAYSCRKIRIVGGMQLSGSGNYCALMDLIHQSAPVRMVC